MSGERGEAGAWRPDLVCKIGGSLLDAGRAPAALEAVTRAAPPGGVLLVAGGGRATDRLRRLHRRGLCTEEQAHWAAVRALDGTALRLAGGCGIDLPLAAALPPPPPRPREGGGRGRDPSAGAPAAAGAGPAGRAAVLVPHGALRAEDPLPHSWDVTSDSIAAWSALRAGAGRLLLLKSRRGGAGEGGRSARDAAAEGLVDRHLPRLLAGAPMAAWVADGRRPGRLLRFLTGDGRAATRLAA